MKLIEVINEYDFIGLWVDDERPIPEPYQKLGWVSATSYQDAIEKLTQYKFENLSLDHDLGFDPNNQDMSGYDIVKWLVQRKYDGFFVPKHIWSHSANPVGRKNIESTVDRYLNDQGQ